MNTPIAIFAYNRPRHTDRLFQSLARSSALARCSVHIYCDGPGSEKDEETVEATKKVVRHWARELSARIIERSTNMGVGRSVVAGVTELCANERCVIVLEDDLLVAPDFLEYVLGALERYRSVSEVLQISGFMYPVTTVHDPDTFFLPLTTTWGWATWDRAWASFHWEVPGSERLFTDEDMRRRFDLDDSYPFSEILRNALAGKNDSWGIRWWHAVCSAAGVVLHPRHSLIWNGGFDNSGRHCTTAQGALQASWEQFSRAMLTKPLAYPGGTECHSEMFARVKRLFIAQHATPQQPTRHTMRSAFSKWLSSEREMP